MVHDSFHCLTSGVALLVNEVSGDNTPYICSQTRVDCTITLDRIIEFKFCIENKVALAGEYIAHDLVSRSVYDSDCK